MTRGDAPRLVSPARAAAIARERRRPVLHVAVLALIALGAAFSFFFSHFPFDVHSSAAVTGLSMPGVGAVPSEQPVLTSNVIPDTVRRDELEQGLRVISGQVPLLQTNGQDTALAAAPATQDPFTLYTVVEGDTASAIAARFGIELRYLLWANPDLRDGELLAVGQHLLIPAGNGALHHMLYGETLSDVAAEYGVPIESIVNWPGNGITSPDQVVEDELIFVPDGVPPVTILPEPTVAPTEPPVFVVAPPDSAPPDPAAAPATSSSGLIWPVYGPISSYMDASHPLGIDIDLFGREGAAIAAATSGTVTFAGGDPCCSYGYHVIVMSPDGIETVYAHFSGFAVSTGQLVGQGQTLGYAGCTGYCTGTHVHFEVIDNGVRVNPLAYLP